MTRTESIENLPVRAQARSPVVRCQQRAGFSRHDFDRSILPESRDALDTAAVSAGDDAGQFVSAAALVLSDHRQIDGYSVCKHAAAYGTRSATVIALPSAGKPMFLFAAGRPCEHDFEALETPDDA